MAKGEARQAVLVLDHQQADAVIGKQRQELWVGISEA